MLDFDFVCSRTEPSVAAMVYPFTGDHKQKFYWGHKEILIPGKESLVTEQIGEIYCSSHLKRYYTTSMSWMKLRRFLARVLAS